MKHARTTSSKAPRTGKAKPKAPPKAQKAAAKPKTPPRPKAAPKGRKAPPKPGSKPVGRVAPGLPPGTPNLACDDPTLGQVIDLRHCELPPGGKRRRCRTIRSVVVGCATPTADHPKRKMMFAVEEGRRFIVGTGEVRKEVRNGEKARQRLGLPDPTCADYSRARAQGIPVSDTTFHREECSRGEPEPTSYTARDDDPWDAPAPKANGAVQASTPWFTNAMAWEALDYLFEAEAHNYPCGARVRDLTRITRNHTFAAALVDAYAVEEVSALYRNRRPQTEIAAAQQRALRTALRAVQPKTNDGRAAAARGVAVRGKGNDPLIGRVVGGEDFAGFIRSPAVGCEGGLAYIVGGQVVSRAKVLSAIRRQEVAAGIRPAPPPRAGARPGASPAPPRKAPARAPVGLPSGENPLERHTRVQSDRVAADWSAVQPGNVIEFHTSDRRVHATLRGVVSSRLPTVNGVQSVEVYALQIRDDATQQWVTRARQDSTIVRSDQGTVQILAHAEPRAHEVHGMMDRYRALRARYHAAHRTLPVTEEHFAALPSVEAESDLARYAMQLVQAPTPAVSTPAPAGRAGSRPLPPRAPRPSSAPVHVVDPAIATSRTLEQRVAAERKDDSPAWDEARVGDVVEFNSTTRMKAHLRGRVSAITVESLNNGRRTGVILDRVQTFANNRWRNAPPTETHQILNTKGTLVFVQRAGASAAPAKGWEPQASSDAALMERYEMVREGLSFYGAEGVAPAPDKFARLTLTSARTMVAALEGRLETERQKMQKAAAQNTGAPDFGAFLAASGAKTNAYAGAYGRAR